MKSQWKMLFLLILIAQACLPVISKECNCNTKSCIIPVNCTHGLVWDRCYCCQLCAKDEGEICGGQDHGYGECGRRLECVVRYPGRYLNRFYEINNQLIGRCEPYSCLFRKCPYGQRCYIKGRYTKCDCNISCSDTITEPVCGETNLKYYKNECELRKEECRLGKKIGISILPCSGPNITKIACFSSMMQLTIRRTLLGRSLPRRLVLNDPQCKAYVNRTHITATTFLNDCGSVIRYTSYSVIYSNTLRTLPPRNAFISRGKSVNITFQCEYNYRKRTRNAVKFTQIRSRGKAREQRGVITRSMKNGMKVEIDTTRNYTVVLRTVKYTGMTVKLMPHYCYVTPMQRGLRDAKCPIIRSGCPVEKNVKITSVSDSKITLQLPGIRFTEAQRPGIRVRCRIKLCFPKSFANCKLNCENVKKRRRRSLKDPTKEGTYSSNFLSNVIFNQNFDIVEF